MQLEISFKRDPLKLPKRYEILERQILSMGGDISTIVRKIDSASEHVESLLSKVQVGGAGQFQLFAGESGSGKTTFLRTLAQFFEEIYVHTFQANDSLSSMIDFIRNHDSKEKNKIFIIDEKDNPVFDKDEYRVFFEKLRILFREPVGEVLLIWPITDKVAAKNIGDLAWEVGRQSISPNSGPIYEFTGLPQSAYLEVANDTIKSLNRGESLESFGVTKEVALSLAQKSSTIGEFYSKIEDLASEMNQKTWSLLEKKVRPKIWFIVASDSIIDTSHTIKSLIQGVNNRFDIDRLDSVLADKNNESQYLIEWRSRKGQAAYLFRSLDVRIFALSPNLALSIIRAYGDKETKKI